MTRHHELEVGLNACGVEVCPHASHRQLCAVASYLHRPGDEDEPQSRVGELYLYQLPKMFLKFQGSFHQRHQQLIFLIIFDLYQLQ